MLQPDLCDYSNTYIVDKRTVTVQTENDKAIDGYNRNLILRNDVPFINFALTINNALISDREDLDIVMPMQSLIEYSKNYSKTSVLHKRYFISSYNKFEI